MFPKKRALAAAVAVVAAVGAWGAGPAQGASGGKESVRAVVAQDERSAPDRGVAQVAAPAGATAALARVQGRIARYVAEHGTAYTFGSYLEPETGRIVVETDAPAEVVAEVTDLSGAPAAEARAAGRVEVRRTAPADTYHRRDDIPPFWGGAGLLYGGGLCSSGYSVQNSAGTRFMVTAGHCYPNGATVLTESGARTFGTVSNRRLPTVTNEPVDMELLGGQSYGSAVYVGGTTSTTGIPVVSAGPATVGYADYCHSGRTTGENCGHTATSTTGQVCTQTGCKSPVIVYQGGTIQQGGDSGGPFYAKDTSGAWIRGHVIASSSTTGYVQPWTEVASRLGVSIVTG